MLTLPCQGLAVTTMCMKTLQDDQLQAANGQSYVTVKNNLEVDCQGFTVETMPDVVTLYIRMSRDSMHAHMCAYSYVHAYRSFLCT